jgi:hypothetical protein
VIIVGEQVLQLVLLLVGEQVSAVCKVRRAAWSAFGRGVRVESLWLCPCAARQADRRSALAGGPAPGQRRMAVEISEAGDSLMATLTERSPAALKVIRVRYGEL